MKYIKKLFLSLAISYSMFGYGQVVRKTYPCNPSIAENLTFQSTVGSNVNKTEKAKQTITAYHVITPGANLTYKSGGSITLTSGFNAVAGSSFTGTIEDYSCSCSSVQVSDWKDVVCKDESLCFNVQNATLYGIKVISYSGQQVYSWNGSVSGTTSCIWNPTVASGDYDVNVEFANECEKLSNSYVLTVTSCGSKLSSTNAIESSEELDVSVYPNPNDGNFTINVNSPDFKAYTVDVFNSIGHVVRHIENVSDKLYQINESGLANGIYTVKLTMGDEYIIKKIIVKK